MATSTGGQYGAFQQSMNLGDISRLTGGGSQLRISKFVNGIETVLASGSLSNPAKNVFFRLEGAIDGTSLQLKLDGVQRLSVQNATYSQGSVGVSTLALSHRVDNVSAARWFSSRAVS